ncbi:phosphoenolpyruvate synthase, partial [Candidatus Falkowbacteria bacterium]|nr:phosphoenolpyruvate synthase [Candidatus Falkowbacteria bacterium]
MRETDAYVVELQTLSRGDVPRVGGKNASLGEMLRNLGGAGVAVPPGFATTARAWRAFVEANALGPRIAAALADLAAGRASLAETGAGL